MKKPFIIIAAIILSACSQQTNTQQVATVPQITATTMVATKMTAIPIEPTQNMRINAIQTSFSYGRHANELTCGHCHIDDIGTKTGKLSWTDETTGQVEAISNPTELCVKCHQNKSAYTSQDVTNLLAHGEFECTNCHNPHDLQAGCGGTLCHDDIQTTLNAQIKLPENHENGGDIPSMCGGTTCHDLIKKVEDTPVYHQPAHVKVPCYVCHDESGLAVILTDNQYWITTDNLQQTTSSAGMETTSHLIGTKVDCSKCHSIDNSWNLMVIPESGEE